MKHRLLLLVALGLLSGCAATYSLVPANPQAEAVGSPKMHVVAGLPAAPMNITMPNGENLPGDVVVDGTVSDPVTPQGGPARYFGLGGGNFFVTAHDANVAIACRALLVGGHGSGLCRDQNGALYNITL